MTLGSDGYWPRFQFLCERAALMLHFSFVFTFYSNPSFCHTLASCQITDRITFTLQKTEISSSNFVLFLVREKKNPEKRLVSAIKGKNEV